MIVSYFFHQLPYEQENKLLLKQLYVPYIQCQCWSRSGLCALSYFICIIYLSPFIYILENQQSPLL